MKLREARVAQFVGEVLYVGGMMLLIAGAFVLTMLGWTKARRFLGRFVEGPEGPAVAT
jgi:hypothetical protein